MAKRREKLSCGCRARVAYYPKRPWADWGRVDVEPGCEKRSHRRDLDNLVQTMMK